MTITAMFDNEGNALPSEYQSKDMNIKGCTIELSYLKHGDCIFDHTRQVQIKEKKANINKFIQARIDSLRKRRLNVVMNYTKGYISESKAEQACARFDKAIELQKAKMV